MYLYHVPFRGLFIEKNFWKSYHGPPLYQLYETKGNQAKQLFPRGM